MIELEKLAGSEEKVKLYSQRRELARKGLPLLTTDEGYFIKSLDPDGTRHGVYGAAKHGYFEAVVQSRRRSVSAWPTTSSRRRSTARSPRSPACAATT